jgi:hypothetical protein
VKTICVTIAAALLSGCGSDRLEPVPVRGQVRLGGGDWRKPGVLYFVPQLGSSGVTRSGLAPFGTDGRFAATTIQPGDGLLPGEYQVHVECWEIPPTEDAPWLARSYVPKRFQSAATSGLTLAVSADAPAPIEVQFDVPQQ